MRNTCATSLHTMRQDWRVAAYAQAPPCKRRCRTTPDPYRKINQLLDNLVIGVGFDRLSQRQPLHRCERVCPG